MCEALDADRVTFLFGADPGVRVTFDRARVRRIMDLFDYLDRTTAFKWKRRT